MGQAQGTQKELSYNTSWWGSRAAQLLGEARQPSVRQLNVCVACGARSHSRVRARVKRKPVSLGFTAALCKVELEKPERPLPDQRVKRGTSTRRNTPQLQKRIDHDAGKGAGASRQQLRSRTVGKMAATCVTESRAVGAQVQGETSWPAAGQDANTETGLERRGFICGHRLWAASEGAASALQVTLSNASRKHRVDASEQVSKRTDPGTGSRPHSPGTRPRTRLGRRPWGVAGCSLPAETPVGAATALPVAS